MKWIYRYLKQAVEPSAAVSLAAIIKKKTNGKVGSCSVYYVGVTRICRLSFLVSHRLILNQNLIHALWRCPLPRFEL